MQAWIRTSVTRCEVMGFPAQTETDCCFAAWVEDRASWDVEGYGEEIAFVQGDVLVDETAEDVHCC